MSVALFHFSLGRRGRVNYGHKRNAHEWQGAHSGKENYVKNVGRNDNKNKKGSRSLCVCVCVSGGTGSDRLKTVINCRLCGRWDAVRKTPTKSFPVQGERFGRLDDGTSLPAGRKLLTVVRNRNVVARSVWGVGLSEDELFQYAGKYTPEKWGIYGIYVGGGNVFKIIHITDLTIYINYFDNRKV